MMIKTPASPAQPPAAAPRAVLDGSLPVGLLHIPTWTVDDVVAGVGLAVVMRSTNLADY